MKLKNKKGIMAILILWMFITTIVKGQDVIAQVSISDGNMKINQLAIYRFSLYVFTVDENPSFPAGTKFKSYLPSTITLNTAAGTPTAVSICRRYFVDTDTSTAFSNCVYNPADGYIAITLSSLSTYTETFDYEIGFIKNPSASQLVTSFRVVIEDSTGTVLYDVYASNFVVIQAGDILSQSLATSSMKVATVNTYTFKFKISNALPGDGKIEIQFPQNEIDIPLNLASSDLAITVYDRARVANQAYQLRKARTITFTNPFGGIAVTPDATKYIIIEVGKILNPKSMKQSSSFIVMTMDSLDQEIDQASTGFTVTPSLPGDIVSSVDTPKTLSLIVNAVSTLYFDLTLPFVYDAGGYLLITFPTEVKIQTASPVCNYQLGLAVNPSQVCTMITSSPQAVKIPNTVLLTRMIFQIGSAQNPPTNKPSSTFMIQAFDKDNYLISQKITGLVITATPATLATVTAIRSQTDVGKQTGNTLTIQFTAQSSLSSTDQIYLKIPFDQMIIGTSNSITCKIKTGSNSLASHTCTLDTTSLANYFIVTMISPCASVCSAATVFTIELSGVRNPEWIVSPQTRSIEVQTMSSDLLWIKDRKITGIYITPNLIEAPIITRTITKTNQVVNQNAEIVVALTLNNRIPSNGLIRLFLPSGGFFNPKTGSISCSDTIDISVALTCTAVLNTDLTKGINYIQFSGRCPTGCLSGKQINIKIISIRNRPSVKTFNNYFELRTYTTEEYKIDYSVLSNEVANLALTNSQYTKIGRTLPVVPILTGALETYEFKMTSQNGIYPNGLSKHEIIFPTDVKFITLQQGQTASCSAVASNSNLNCNILAAEKKLVISNNDKALTFEDQEITITLPSYARNPQSTKTSGKFTFQTLLLDGDDQQYYLQDYDFSMSITADTPNSLQSVSVTRSDQLINDPAEYTISFKTFNPIPFNSIITIKIPKDQVIFSSDQTRVFSDQSSNIAITPLSEVGVSDLTATHVIYTFTEWCSNGASECASGSILSIKLTGVINPPSTRSPKNSFIIIIQTSDGYYTDQILKGIFTTPFLSAGPFKSLSFSESVTTVGELSTLMIDIRISNPITLGQVGKLRVTFPSEMYYPPISNNDLIVCDSELATTACTPVTIDSAVGYGNEISSIDISLQCDIKACAKDTDRSFRIKNMRNRFSMKAFTGTISVTTVDDEEYIFDSSSKTLAVANLAAQLNPGSSAKFQSVSRSVLYTFTATDINLQFNINVRFLIGSILQVFIPKDQFEVDSSQSIKCKNTLTGDSLTCTQMKLADNNYFGIQLKEYCLTQVQTSYCPEGYLFNLKVQGFKNRYNTKASSVKLYFKTFTSELNDIEYSQNSLLPTNNLMPVVGTIDSNYVLTNIFTGKTTDFILTVNLQNKILANDYIQLTFSTSLFTTIAAPVTCGLGLTLGTVSQSICTNKADASSLTAIEAVMNQGSASITSIVIKISNIQNWQIDKPHSTTLIFNAYTKDSGITLGISSATLVVLNKDILVPSPFTALTIERSLRELAKAVTTTFTFQTPFAIMANSKFRVQLPKSQFVKQDGATLECLFQNVKVDCTEIDSTNSLTVTASKSSPLCLLNSCPSSTNLVIKILGLQNPLYMNLITLNPTLDILNEDDYGIFSNQADVKPGLKLGEFSNVIITQTGNLSTSLPTSYNVSFKFPDKLVSNYRLFVKFPTQMILPPLDKVTPELACFDWATGKKFNCIVNQRTNGYITQISIEDYCIIASCNPTTTQSFNITNINNVDFTRNRSDIIKMYEVMPENYITAEGSFQEYNLPAFIPQNITDVNVTRDQTRPGTINVDLSIIFRTPVKIPNRGIITYTIPREQVQLPQFSRIVCQSIETYPVDLECSIEVRNATHVVLNVTEWCSADCQVNSTIAMKILKTTNPTSLDANNPKNSIGIYVMHPTYQRGIVQRIDNLKATPLDEVTMENVFMLRDKNILGADDNMTVYMTIPDKMPVIVKFAFTFPFNTAFAPTNNATQKCLLYRQSKWEQRACNYSYNTTSDIFGLKPISNITITDFCTAALPCVSGQIYILKMPVSNPRVPSSILSLNETSIFKVSLNGDKFELGQTRISATNLTEMSAGLIQAAIRNNNDLACFRTGQLCNMTLDIQTQSPYYGVPRTYLQINLPSELSLSKASCTAKLLNKTMNCRVSGNREIQIRHTLTLATKDYVAMNYGFKILLQINDIQLPFSTEETGKFTFVSYETVNSTLEIMDQSIDNITYTVTQPNPFSMITVNRTNQEPNSKTSLIFQIVTSNNMPKESFIEVQIPETQAIIDGTSPTCFKGATVSGAQYLKCSLVSDKTFRIENICFPSGCSANSKLAFGIANSILYNPEFELGVFDLVTDSIKVTTFITSSKDKRNYIIQRTGQNLYAKPSLIQLDTLHLTEVKLDSLEASDLQRLNFKATYTSQSFVKEYLRVKFFNANFTQDLLYPMKVTLNGQESTITNVKLISTGIIDYIIFQCGYKNCKDKSELAIEIKGFRNPAFKVLNRTTSLPVIQFSELVQRPDRLFTNIATTIGDGLTKLETNQILNAETKFANYSSGASNNSLEILFSIENNPDVDQNGLINVKMPSGYSVPYNLSCQHIFTGQKLNCSAINGTVQIQGYFNNTSNRTYIGRLLQYQLTDNSTVIQNTVVAIKILNITNPSLTQINSTLSLSLDSGGLLYTLDNSTTTVSSMKLTTNCADSNCAQCSLIDPRLCVKCKVPSSAPLRQGYQCKERCDSGYFEYNYQCYKCAFGCKECQTFDQCLSCNTTVRTLIDGVCFDIVTKYQQKLECPEGCTSSNLYGCSRTEQCSSIDCLICGVDKDYCHKCRSGIASINGQCMSKCPDRYTANSKGKCIRCDSTCQQCNKTAKSCTTCRLDFYDSFKLDLTKNSCTSTCSDGSILRVNNHNVCEQCGPACKTCAGTKTQCTSCYYHKETFQDLFYHNDKCLAKCPSGYYQNYDTHICEETSFSLNQVGPLYLIFSIIVAILLLLFSAIRTGRKHASFDIVIALLTQIEFVNRLILLASLWSTTHVLSFTATGMNLLLSSLFGIYFATNVLWPIVTQMKLLPAKTFAFKLLATLLQFSGPNTIRLATSRFLMLRSCSLPRQLLEITYYLRYIELMSALVTFFNLCQLLVGLDCIMESPRNSGAFGFGLNAVIINAALTVCQAFKYIAYRRATTGYEKVARDPQN